MSFTMTVQRYIVVFAGLFIMISLALGVPESKIGCVN